MKAAAIILIILVGIAVLACNKPIATEVKDVAFIKQIFTEEYTYTRIYTLPNYKTFTIRGYLDKTPTQIRIIYYKNGKYKLELIWGEDKKDGDTARVGYNKPDTLIYNTIREEAEEIPKKSPTKKLPKRSPGVGGYDTLTFPAQDTIGRRGR